ncbi:glycoside hydrolase family 88 protein [Paenibacillus sp. GXUN7292]|uniref:glycoside hydrolase family 88 protein n=1 Tax=Paenibacillus sp. GXUN7292 TaxID=3422499 RepID=UPI003D7E068A
MKPFIDTLEHALQCCITKSEIYLEQIKPEIREYISRPDGQYLQGKQEDYIPLRHIFAWTPSFFLGMGFWTYQVKKETKWLKWLHSFSNEYAAKVCHTPLETMHDLGFLYSPYAVALYKATNDSHMKKIALQAAVVLAMRFVPNGSYIQAWGRMDHIIPGYVDQELAKNHFFTQSKGLAIIDCMMNLPLLFWASEETNHPFYKNIAVAHADMTLKYFFREDGSIYHAFRFHEETGQPIGGDNYCGYAIESHWARGTAWAIYGFISAFSYTGYERYLNAAVDLSLQFIAKSEDDGIPVWDFKLPQHQPAAACGSKPWTDWDYTNPANKSRNRDTSAAAIAASAFYEILKFKKEPAIQCAMDHILMTLATKYTNYEPPIPGILKEQNGQGVYTIFGDYFYMEALCKKLYGFESIW